MVSSYGPLGGVQGTNPFTALRRAKQRGLSLIVVDPRRTELAASADVFLQIRPGEDPTLLAGVIRVILSEGLHDREFCRRWVSDLDSLKRTVEPFAPGYVADRCAVDADDLIRAARLFAAGSRGTAGTGTGPNMAPHSSLTEHLVLVLNTLCGRVNRAGDLIESGSFLSPAKPRRAQVSPPTDPATGPPSRVRGLRGYHGEMPTATLAEEILMPGRGRIRALVVSGGNPVVAWPDQQLTVRALRDLELLVVIDHRMTATAELAHAVIPPRLSLERADVPHVMDRWYTAPYTNYTPAVVEAEGDLYAEWEVFWELARRLGSRLPLPGGDVPFDRRPSDDEMIDLIYAGARMSLDEIRRHRGVVHEHLALVAQPADDGADAKFTVAPKDLMAELTEVRIECIDPRPAESAEATPYTFRLVSRRLKAVLNSLGTELPGVRAKAGTTNCAYLNPDDMATLGVAPDELVEISSPTGSLVAVAAAASDVRRGVVSMAHGWGGVSLDDDDVRAIGAPTNRLVSTVDGHDRMTGMPVQSAIRVRVVRAETAK
jgi:anaerobic selenocysteine-containing dehydrogenase